MVSSPSSAAEVVEPVRVGKVRIHPYSFDAAVDLLVHSREAPVGSVRLINAWCVVVAEDHAPYRNVVNGPGVSLPDGAAVVTAMRKRPNGSATERVRGPSLFTETLDRGRKHEVRHFFLGSTPATLRALVIAARQRFPGVQIVDSWSPPFGPFDDAVVAEAVRRIQASHPDILWIGLGAPKQDVAAQRLTELTQVTAVGVGAAFDFVAGTVREAPRWVQRAGLEWLFRFASEPRRLWRRYLIGNLRFLRIASRR